MRVVIFRSHGPQQSVFCPIGGHHAPGDENGAPVNGQVCPNKGTQAGKGVIEVAVPDQEETWASASAEAVAEKGGWEIVVNKTKIPVA
ncbi:uncharacterized protein CCOS01_05517 [Colletotrichum costaricense]|uniref:Uncharacterized protein n=1 Tax=Colletotrichum costaricense TaxID=1209916 RepID=A0AAJ0E382_9PEZI|nr:uncharacterized protein CCOS01_05517 [Colletotrichum costaricense]KAK1530414.1 hypothetical protein CCOS01_05517 [Colletotrichum costaricense]